MAISAYLLVITLNVNGLNALIKRQCDRLDKKTRTTRDSLQGERHTQKVRGCIKIFHASRNDKKAGVVILISDKIKSIKKNKEGHYIMIKRMVGECCVIFTCLWTIPSPA